jgi:hypothetical protein
MLVRPTPVGGPWNPYVPITLRASDLLQRPRSSAHFGISPLAVGLTEVGRTLTTEAAASRQSGRVVRPNGLTQWGQATSSRRRAL